MAWDGTVKSNWSPGDVDTAADRNKVGDNLKYLKGQAGTVVLEDGVNLGANELTINSVEIVGADGEVNKDAIEKRYVEYINWGLSHDAFTTGGDNQTIRPQASELYMVTGGTTNEDAFIYDTYGSFVYFCDAGSGTLTIEWPIKYIDGDANVNTWIRLATGVNDPPSETVYHLGFKLIGADIYASNADNATQTIADTGENVSAAQQLTRLKAVYTIGTDIKYYVNDSLKLTHTTHLPAVNSSVWYFHAHVRTLADTAQTIKLGRIFVESYQ